MDLKMMWNKVISGLKMVSMEPLIFFLIFGFAVKGTAMQDLLVNRSCRILMQYPDSVCSKLSEDEHKLVKAEAITYGVNLNTGCLVLVTIPALVVSIFVGPWSDKYGRKYPLVVAISGLVLESILTLIFTLNKSASPFYFLLSSLFPGISGGLIVAFSCIYSYMSEVSDEKSRTTRFAILEVCVIMAAPLGTIIGGKAFEAGSYVAVMGIGIASLLLAFLWLLFMIKEDNETRLGKTRRELIRDIFRIDNLKQSYQTAVKPRLGSLRLQLWLMIICLIIIRMVNIGSATITYYYVNLMFDWDVTKFADSTTAFHFLNAFANLAAVPIFNIKLLLHEAAVGLVGIMSVIAKNVAFAVAVKPELVYFAMFCGLLSTCESIAVLSRISKLVSKTELGRVFSLLSICEALSPVLGTLLISQIFNAGKTTYPGLPFAVAAVAILPVGVVFWWMLKLPTTSFYPDEDPEHELEDIAKGAKSEQSHESQEPREVPLSENKIRRKV